MKLTRQDLVLAIANQACREANNPIRMIGLIEALFPWDDGEQLEHLRAAIEAYGIDELYSDGNQ